MVAIGKIRFLISHLPSSVKTWPVIEARPLPFHLDITRMFHTKKGARYLSELPRRNKIRQQSTWLNPSTWFSASSKSAPLEAVSSTVERSLPTHENRSPSVGSSSNTSFTHTTQSKPSSRSPTFTSINASEISHFSRLSSQWWDEKGEFGLLHKMNPVRMEFVRGKVKSAREDDDGWSFASRHDVKRDHGQAWLQGMDVLDVGCGGGLLSEVGYGPRGCFLFYY
jgi:hypothetical protein